MSKKVRKILCLGIALLMLLTVLSACGGSTNKDSQTAQSSDSTTKTGQSNSAGNQELLKYSIFLGFTDPIKEVDNTNDVVTPFIEKKFNIKVGDITQPVQTISGKERLNMFIAANNLPDVVICGKDVADYGVGTGKFADLTDYIKDMPNLNKYFDQKMWARYLNNGKKYQIPLVLINPNDSKYKDDPFALSSPWCLWAREDILTKLGYKFTPLDELAKATTDVGKKPTLDDYKIEPAIDTPDKFLDLLRKIKALNLKVGDKPLIPFSGSWWNTFHMGTMFDYGHWKVDDSGKVTGYLGAPEAKEWHKMLNTMYNEGLIDKDYILQKDDALQTKIASGRAAAGMYIPDMAGAIDGMAKVNPEAKIRFITWPKKSANSGYFDVYEGGFWRMIISKDCKDIKRLTQYFDWCYSDEGLDILTWGPESAGLWEMKDGKKVFKDKDLESSLLNGTKDGQKGTEYYGLYTPSKNGMRPSFLSRAAICAPAFEGYNPFDSRKSYPIKLDKYLTNKAICGDNGFDYTGKAATGDGGANTSTFSSYYWGKYQNDRIGKILSAKTDAEFEKAWKEQFDLAVKEGKYNEAAADMEKWFKDNK